MSLLGVKLASLYPARQSRFWSRFGCAHHRSLYNGLAVNENSRQDPSAESRARGEHEPMLFCPVCSRRLAERKCKLYCEQCGYYMSCADYY